jgi:hypothetical protein
MPRPTSTLEQAMLDLGVPARDPGDVPDSPLRFPDGGHYRLEVAGVERASSMEALVTEARRLAVPIHRVIGTVGGATHLSKQELRDFARTAAEARIEVIMTLGPRRFWDNGRQIATPEGIVSGMRVRGSDNLHYLLKDMERCLAAGFRGFLIADEGVLWLANQLRAKGVLPADTVFKVSVFAGHANAAGALLLQANGADSFNPVADLTIPMLASIRRAVRIPVDVYVWLVGAMGGFNRFYEGAEIARVAAPCYFKIEPGQSEELIYQPWTPEATHAHLVREKVRYAAIIADLVHDMNPSVQLSPAGAADLAVPVV